MSNIKGYADQYMTGGKINNNNTLKKIKCKNHIKY